MMVFLFSGSTAVLLACEALTAMFMMTRLYDGAGFLSAALVLIIGSIISVFASNTYAGLLHHRALLVLYSMLQPDEFIRLYAPLQQRRFIPTNVRFTLTAYLSNGYAAKGDFAEARRLLDSAPAAGKRQALARELILTGNRACIALAEGSTKEASAQIEHLQSLITDSRMPAKKRAAQQDILRTLRAQLNVLQECCTQDDCDHLRQTSKAPGSVLRKTELNYYIGKAYALLGNEVLAKEYLTPAAASKTTVYGRIAAAALKTLRASIQTGGKK